MENKLEQLLNSLIEKGFRPFWRYDKLMWSWRFWSRQFVKFWMFPEEEFTLRELTSINSGLWQFVCENKLLPKKNWYVWNLIDHYNYDKSIKWIAEYNSFYYIIESSLKDESELENFLLSNIKIDVENN